MKIQNLAIIFVIIILPIMVMLTVYISRQTDTLETQESYDSKILTASKDAIKAFELNTSDWQSVLRK